MFILTFFLCAFVYGHAKSFNDSSLQFDIKPFYNETLVYKIKWTLLTVGKITMKSYTSQKKNQATQVKIYATITPFEQMKSLYYIQGNFGSIWNYGTQKPIYSFEEIYQGKSYAKRSFRFKGDDVRVTWLEKEFLEYNFPHSKKQKILRNESLNIDAKKIQDLLGAFYYIRGFHQKLNIGDVKKIKVLPAGHYKILILKILDIQTRDDVPFFGKKKILYVQTGLANYGSESAPAGIFLNTKSKIYLWITYDKNFVPVKFSTKLPYLGKVYAELEKYSQP